MAMGRKCCECRPDLNPHQAAKCKHEGQGILAYDRGRLFTDFAKLPDECYESDEGTFAYESKYDSDSAFDFEAELKLLAPDRGVDSLPSARVSASRAAPRVRLPLRPRLPASDSDTDQTASEEAAIMAGSSDYESDPPPPDAAVDSDPLLAPALQRKITDAVTEAMRVSREDDRQQLQKLVTREIQQALQQHTAVTQQALQQHTAVTQQALLHTSKQIQQLAAGTADRAVESNVQARLSGAVAAILEGTELMLKQHSPLEHCNAMKDPLYLPHTEPGLAEPETDIMGNPVPEQAVMGRKRLLESRLVHVMPVLNQRRV